MSVGTLSTRVNYTPKFYNKLSIVLPSVHSSSIHGALFAPKLHSSWLNFYWSVQAPTNWDIHFDPIFNVSTIFARIVQLSVIDLRIWERNHLWHSTCSQLLRTTSALDAHVKRFILIQKLMLSLMCSMAHTLWQFKWKKYNKLFLIGLSISLKIVANKKFFAVFFSTYGFCVRQTEYTKYQTSSNPSINSDIISNLVSIIQFFRTHHRS